MKKMPHGAKRKCAWCEAPFQPKRSTARYCSAKCRVYAFHKGHAKDEVFKWKRIAGQALVAAEVAAWRADHPGSRLRVLGCGMTDAEKADYEAWENPAKLSIALKTLGLDVA
jgi:hypothetical protein